MVHRKSMIQGFSRIIGIVIPVCLFFLALMPVTANAYSTPGEGVSWTMDDVVADSEGAVTGSGGVYQLHEYLQVSENDTLTLSPGDVLVVDAGTVSIPVYGRLNAVGTSSNGITFTSGASTPSPGDWDGIEVFDTGSVNLVYCSIYYTETGVEFEYILDTALGSVISHCTIAYITENGIYTYFFNGPSLDILDSQIIGTSANNCGLEMEYTGRTMVTISHNVITTHGYNGIEPVSYTHLTLPTN